MVSSDIIWHEGVLSGTVLFRTGSSY